MKRFCFLCHVIVSRPYFREERERLKKAGAHFDRGFFGYFELISMRNGKRCRETGGRVKLSPGRARDVSPSPIFVSVVLKKPVRRREGPKCSKAPYLCWI